MRQSVKEIKVDIQLKEMRNIKFNDDLFIPMKTKTIVDSILSTEGGVFPGASYLWGKTNYYNNYWC